MNSCSFGVRLHRWPEGRPKLKEAEARNGSVAATDSDFGRVSPRRR
jgi:hypothetical protein